MTMVPYIPEGYHMHPDGTLMADAAMSVGLPPGYEPGMPVEPADTGTKVSCSELAAYLRSNGFPATAAAMLGQAHNNADKNAEWGKLLDLPGGVDLRDQIAACGILTYEDKLEVWWNSMSPEEQLSVEQNVQAQVAEAAEGKEGVFVIPDTPFEGAMSIAAKAQAYNDAKALEEEKKKQGQALMLAAAGGAAYFLSGNRMIQTAGAIFAIVGGLQFAKANVEVGLGNLLK